MHKPGNSLFTVFKNELTIRNYSPRTIKAYLGVLKAFVRYFSPRHPRDLTLEDIHQYLFYLLDTKLVSRSTIDQTISSLKFLYNELYKRDYTYKDLPRPKKESKLPVILSQQDIQAILKATTNIKYRTMLEMLYGSGLRISEVVKLKVQDLDIPNLTVFIRNAKGKKDRITVLSPIIPNPSQASLLQSHQTNNINHNLTLSTISSTSSSIFLLTTNLNF